MQDEDEGLEFIPTVASPQGVVWNLYRYLFTVYWPVPLCVRQSCTYRCPPRATWLVETNTKRKEAQGVFKTDLKRPSHVRWIHLTCDQWEQVNPDAVLLRELVNVVEVTWVATLHCGRQYQPGWWLTVGLCFMIDGIITVVHGKVWIHSLFHIYFQFSGMVLDTIKGISYCRRETAFVSCILIIIILSLNPLRYVSPHPTPVECVCVCVCVCVAFTHILKSWCS